jgi:hypothetical protein
MGRKPSPLALALVVIAVALANACSPDVACDPAHARATCPAGTACSTTGLCEPAVDSSSEGEGEGGREGEGEGEGEGADAASTNCGACPGAYCDDVVDDGERGSCVPLAGTVTLCADDTGGRDTPSEQAPAAWDGVNAGNADDALCGGEFPAALAISVRYFDVEGDFDPGSTEIRVVADGFEHFAIASTIALVAAGAASVHGDGTLTFTVCLGSDDLGGTVELIDASGHESNGDCVLR